MPWWDFQIYPRIVQFPRKRYPCPPAEICAQSGWNGRCIRFRFVQLLILNWISHTFNGRYNSFIQIQYKNVLDPKYNYCALTGQRFQQLPKCQSVYENDAFIFKGKGQFIYASLLEIFLFPNTIIVHCQGKVTSLSPKQPFSTAKETNSTAKETISWIARCS